MLELVKQNNIKFGKYNRRCYTEHNKFYKFDFSGYVTDDSF